MNPVLSDPIVEKQILAAERPLHIWDLNQSARPLMVEALRGKAKFTLVVTSDEARAEKLVESMRFFDRNAMIFPAKDVLFYYADVHGNATAKKRLAVMKRICSDEPTVIVTTVDGLMDRLPDLKYFKAHTFSLSVGDSIDLDQLKADLTMEGYENVPEVETSGQFSVRGGILDIFPLTEECPLRVEFFGDEIDSIREFDVESQRSISELEHFLIFPASEYVLSEERKARGLARIEKEEKEQIKNLKKTNNDAAGHLKKTVEKIKTEISDFNSTSGLDSLVEYFYGTTVGFLDYMPEGTAYFIDEPKAVAARAQSYFTEFSLSMQGRLMGGYILPGQADVLTSAEETLERLVAVKPFMFSEFYVKQDLLGEVASVRYESKGIQSYKGSFVDLEKDLETWRKKKYKIVIISPSATRAKRYVNSFMEADVPAFFSTSQSRELAPKEVMVTTGSLEEGFFIPSAGLVVIAEGEILKRQEQKKKYKRFQGQAISTLAELSVGDYVVHEHHGIGVYRGISQETSQGRTKDYINIDYAGGSKLFVPVEDMDRIGKYSDKEGKAPKLNNLGGSAWQKTRTRVQQNVDGVAKELVELYAIRQNHKGYAFSEDSLWQHEFEESFPYDETPDQMRAIRDMKKDMESDKIMDRLICGDVGFGKTEVAIRAAFKCAQDGRQVAYLVPTTILAEQHYNTFMERMKDYPINVRMLSRFHTAKENRQIIEGLKNGSVDIVIGTHRLLSKDVGFHKLGLLIIDEEQRFGVKAKEAIKEMKKTVDVLTLTATPIPRTLHMSLVGIRDMSLLEEAPIDRRPIQTYVMEYDREIVKEAINRELARDGQVFYVYNRVEDIMDIEGALQQMLPEARIAYAHGKMNEKELENIMHAFINHEIDVLVSTTIIETGLDISNANTIIIHNAERFGLSQLYQLRGRVGRSGRNAFAFMMYQPGVLLKDVAQKRLSAIREFTELGSGYKISMRDLEIRGAGNVLGKSQSGHMEEVGYDLYVKMLNHAIRTMKGEKIEEEFETKLEIPVDAYIPETYIKNEGLKLEFYRKISAIENEEDVDAVLAEAKDRFGNIPHELERLVNVALMRAHAHDAQIAIVRFHANNSMCDFLILSGTNVRVEKIPDFLAQYNSKKDKTRAKLLTGKMSGFSVRIESPYQDEMLAEMEKAVKLINDMLIVKDSGAEDAEEPAALENKSE